MSYKRRSSDIYTKLIKCMDNNDLSSFLNILNKHQSNVDIEYHDKESGHTLLTYACSKGLFDFIKTLIENKDANINHCNAKSKDSPLHYATSSNNGVILKFLVSNDADVFLQNKDGHNALDYSLAMDHRTSYHELKKIMENSYEPPRIQTLPRSTSKRQRGRKSKHKASRSGPVGPDAVLQSVSALDLTAKLSDLSFPDIPESPSSNKGTSKKNPLGFKGLRLKPSHSELTPQKTPKSPTQKPYAKRYRRTNTMDGYTPCTHHCGSMRFDEDVCDREYEQQHQEMNQMIHRMQTYPLSVTGLHGLVAMSGLSTLPGMPGAMPSLSTMSSSSKSSSGALTTKTSVNQFNPVAVTSPPTHRPTSPHIMNPNYMITNHRKSKSRIFGHFGSLSSKRGSKRLSQESCKSCIILQNEVLKLRNEREVLQRKMTMSVHGLVLQKELVRRQEMELRILKRKLQAMCTKDMIDGDKSFSPTQVTSPSTPSISRSVGVENAQYFVEDFIMDNELDMLSDGTPPARFRRVTDGDIKESAETADDHLCATDDGYAFSFPKTEGTNCTIFDDEKSMDIPLLDAPSHHKSAGSRRRDHGQRRGAQTQFPSSLLDRDLDGVLATDSAPNSTASPVSPHCAGHLNSRSCHSKKSSVGLTQSVTEDVAHSLHSIVTEDGDEDEEDEKSQSLGFDDNDHYDEEYVEMMPIMEGLEGVTMTNAGNPGKRSPNLKHFSHQRSVEMKESGIKCPLLLSPRSVVSVKSADAGMDDDLLNRLTANTPTPLMQRRSSDNLSMFELDRISCPDELTDDDMECHNQSERWKLFQSSELAQLFSVLQYRTYCYCEREKRTSLRLKQMMGSDQSYLAKMEQLHSMAIAEELVILQPILNLETLSNFLQQLVDTERELDVLFNPHQQCHDAVHQSIERQLKHCGIQYRTQPVFNWAVSDYQQMWNYQQVLHEQFQRFLVNISSQLHDANIYCCHKDDFDGDNKYRHSVTTKTSMVSLAKRSKEDVGSHYRRRFGESFDAKDTVFSAPKNSSRTFFKVFYDFDGNVSHLTDFLRGSFVFDNFEDLYHALFVIHDYCKKHGPKTSATTSHYSDGHGHRGSVGSADSSSSTSPKVGILKYKNSFLSGSKLNNGWRQIVVNVPLCGGQLDGHSPSVPIVCEIQLHFCLFWQFKDSTHRMYEISRLFKIRDHVTGKSKNLAMECAKQFYGN